MFDLKFNGELLYNLERLTVTSHKVIIDYGGEDRYIENSEQDEYSLMSKDYIQETMELGDD